MAITEIETTAQALVAGAKGILAADETARTITRRFEAMQIESTPESRRAYREMLFTTPGISEFLSGVILQDETIRQKSAQGTGLADVLAQQGILPGIKVDNGVQPLAGSPGETVTEGLDGLRDRLKEYCAKSARFAKWRAVIAIGDNRPSTMCVNVNAHALARYAALCQDEGVVPIVEPEVLMDGSHPIERSEEVTGNVLRAVFNALLDQRVSLEGMLLKPNMVISGKECPKQASTREVAERTLRCLRRHVPSEVPGIVFLSGGQDPVAATEHLNAINRLDSPKPWKLSFSYGRALQDEALRAWLGKSDNLEAGQQAFFHRARCHSAAVQGRYASAMEVERAIA
jgi:fructose-bisphosphate aldolase class I